MSVTESLRHVLVWCRRVRQRRGYGVHSPYAYNLIKQVFFETGTFYAYDGLERALGHSRTCWQRKTDRLMLRLANEVQPQRIVVAGPHLDVPARYAEAGCRRARRMDVSGPMSTWPPHLLEQPQVDFWLWEAQQLDLKQFETVAAAVAPQSVAVVYGIYRSRQATRLWRSLERSPRSVVTFDLYDVGIVCFDTQYNKQSYRVSF